jgi:20S proteasome alpha/beta subunit|tara:strand:+ start:2022 stop:2411 length:390 start_codon:yes stop_codon:yes gene_type:complete
MKKYVASTLLLATFALTGCTTTGGVNNSTGTAIGTANEIGMNVFKAAIDNQCRSQIEKQNAWRIASVAMTETQEEAVKSNVCGCVSEQAPQQVTIVELGNAAIDSQYRTQLVARVVAKSLQSCYASFTK